MVTANRGYATHACSWMSVPRGNRLLLVGGIDPYATFAKAVVDEASRRTGVAVVRDQNFVGLGHFGAMVPYPVPMAS